MFNNLKQPDLWITDENQGLYYRFSSDIADSHLVTGTLNREEAENAKEMEEWFSGWVEEGECSIFSNHIDAYLWMLDSLQPQKSMAIQDDMFPWFGRAKDPDFGKVFLLDRQDTNVHHIFFDDNARPERSNIDTRDLQSG